jgi:hypothetical protein
VKKVAKSRWGAAFVALVVACAGKDRPPPGELIVAVSTDSSPPKDIDTLHVQVLSDGRIQFDSDYELGPNGLLLPATLGLLAGANAATPAVIRVYARKGGATGTVRVLREATVTVPEDRVVMFRMPIDWLCYDDAAVSSTGDVTDTKCTTPGQTCAGGQCVDAVVDGASLPAFSPGAVFGGGTGHGDGQCFDTVACFAQAVPATVDMTACTIAKPASGPINVAMEIETGAGACVTPSGPCFIALEGESPEGWQTSTADPTTIDLPAAVCSRILAGKVSGVVTASACATKAVTTPPCGPGSSVGGGEVDGGAD